MATLAPLEIQLIKGLAAHRSLTATEIQAYFSKPSRPVPVRLVAAIAENRAATSERDYPTATDAMCQRFLATWHDYYPWHRFSVMRAGGLGLQYPGDTYSFSYRYHPVGQGGFCSGWFTRRDQSRFHFVYDCGTEHGGKAGPRARLQREIDALKTDVGRGAKPLTLDLVTLSHFDEDHLSGLTDLVSVFRLERLVLPHLSPWRRLCVALDKRATLESELLAFIVAPTAYLRTRFPDRIGEIILVGPGGDVPEGPVVPPEAAPPEGAEFRGAEEKVPASDDIPAEHDDGAGADEGLQHSNVRLLRPGSAISIDRLWEFVPYNDERMAADVTDTFKSDARPLARQVRDHNLDENTRRQALRDLQALYDRTFRSRKIDPHRARRRNEISLFLYSGPIGNVELLDYEEQIVRCGLPSLLCWSGNMSCLHPDRFGQMFTGDGYLYEQDEWDAFRTYFHRHGRLHRAGLFQVPHHGSHKNWLPGRARRLRPAASIFCSNPSGTHRHPRPQVLADFMRWNPQQVDGSTGWLLRGWYGFVS